MLAAELGLSRGVVTESYRRLAEEGQLEGRRRGGTVVVAAPVPPRPGARRRSRAGTPPAPGPCSPASPTRRPSTRCARPPPAST
ncbi:GntR family transcriptional regulator [Streptomyces sp. NPDC090026]|uniref:GntR family transcriptional regulator n=1 Tax=Streptomyces sp. NPDC090026 TaxID=3365923 RepID=UPI003815A69D